MASSGVADKRRTAKVARTAMRHATATRCPAGASVALTQLASQDARGTHALSVVTMDPSAIAEAAPTDLSRRR